MTLDQAFTGLPTDPAALAGVVQGLLMHEHIAPAYGLSLERGQARRGACAAGRGDRPPDRGARCAAADRGARAGRAAGRRVPPLHAAACRDAAPRRHSGPCPLRLRRLFREGQVSRPLGDRVLERRPQGLGAGRCPARRPPARALPDRLRSARRAARPVPGGGRRLAALPRRPGRSGRLRHPRHAWAVVHRRQRHSRRRRPQRPGHAAVGRLGRDAPEGRGDRYSPSSTGSPH